MSSYSASTILRISGTCFSPTGVGGNFVISAGNGDSARFSLEREEDGTFVGHLGGESDFSEWRSIPRQLFWEMIGEPLMAREDMIPNEDELAGPRNRRATSPEAREKLARLVKPLGEPGEDDACIVCFKQSEDPDPEGGFIEAEDASLYFLTETRVDWHYFPTLGFFVRERFAEEITKQIDRSLSRHGRPLLVEIFEWIADAGFARGRSGPQTLTVVIEERCWNSQDIVEHPSNGIIRTTSIKIVYEPGIPDAGRVCGEAGIGFLEQIRMIGRTADLFVKSAPEEPGRDRKLAFALTAKLERTETSDGIVDPAESVRARPVLRFFAEQKMVWDDRYRRESGAAPD